MNGLLSTLLGALLSTNQPAAVSNLVAERTGLTVQIPDPNDPVEKEYQKLLQQDDEAQAEVDTWITDNQKFAAKGVGLTEGTLKLRIEQRLSSVSKAYEDFLQRHPNHTRARLAYGGFLNDIGREHEAVQQWEKARELDPKNPAPWNNLANYYGHHSPVTKAFEYYTKAIELSPNEPVYYQNLATTVYLFRKDAQEFFKLTEGEVFTKALNLYRKALALDPQNFPLATDLAQTFYGIKPLRYDEAMTAWKEALKIARDEIEREGVHIHMARVQINGGRLAEARTNLNLVTNQMYVVVKERLLKKLQNETSRTNTPPVAVTPKQ